MYNFIFMLYQVSFHIEEINTGISGNCSIGWWKKTSRDKRELVGLLHRETVLCQFCYENQWLRNRNLTITYGRKPGQCMFNVQEWECTAVRAHISLSLQDCWQTTGDCWEMTAWFVISCINPNAILPMGATDEFVEMADAARQLNSSSPACINGVSAKKETLHKLYWCWLAAPLGLQINQHATLLFVTTIPSLCTLAYWSLTTSYIIAYLPSK